MNNNEFIEELSKININLTDKQLKKLEKFYDYLIKTNETMNLTRIVEKEEVYLKHFYDSLTISMVINLNKKQTLCDIGSGAGFPGVVLGICFPNLNITLVDSLLKRVNYLNGLVKELEIDNIKAIHSRGEDYKEKYDIVTARAVAPFERLIPYTIHLLKKEGTLIAMKANVDKEIEENKKVFNKNKCYISSLKEIYLPKENSVRNLVSIKIKDNK